MVAINDLTDAATNAHLLKWDTTYGRYCGDVSVADGNLVVDGRAIKVIAERDPAAIPWKDLGANIVIESTGLFTDGTKAKAHFIGGAKRSSSPPRPKTRISPSYWASIMTSTTLKPTTSYPTPPAPPTAWRR